MTIRGLLAIAAAAVIAACNSHTSAAHAGTFLQHKSHLTLTQKVAYFKRSIHHEAQVVAWLHSPAAPRTSERVSEIGWFRAALAWHKRLLVRYSAKLLARTRPASPVSSLRAYAGPCLSQIIDNEGSGWNPQQWNSSGSGAYGLPQALPGSKMATAGADWATNPYTQIRWMRGYVVGRYGSCEGALAHWSVYRSY